jgi:hypothetical protein
MLKCTHRGSIPFVIRILVIPVVIRHSSFKSMSRIDRPSYSQRAAVFTCINRILMKV